MYRQYKSEIPLMTNRIHFCVILKILLFSLCCRFTQREMSIAVHGTEAMCWTEQLEPCDQTETFGGSLDCLFFLFVCLVPVLIELTSLQAPTLPAIWMALKIKMDGGRRLPSPHFVPFLILFQVGHFVLLSDDNKSSRHHNNVHGRW